MSGDAAEKLWNITIMKNHILTILLFLTISDFALAQTRDVQEIQIISAWGGFGPAGKSELTITRKLKGYYSNDNKVETQLVENLLNAIDENEISKPSLANLGMTQEWLDVNAQKGVEEYASVYFSMGADNQKELFYSTLKNQRLVEILLLLIFSGGWTDDYPRIEIKITEIDGNTFVTSSDAQPLFMLPWKIIKKDKTISTYNANIAKALASLLPEKFINRERLTGNNLKRELAKKVMDFIHEDWNRLDVQNKAKATLDDLGKIYGVLSPEINSYHGLDFGKEWVKGSSTETNLHAVLRQDQFPKGLYIKLVLPFQNQKVENVDIFQNKINNYTNLVLSIDWLKEFVRVDEQTVYLRFVHNRSFSEKAMQTFAVDMRKIGRSELIAEVEKEQENIALIAVGRVQEYYQSYWLVLPNKKVILWRHGSSNLLRWSHKDFLKQECSDDKSTLISCAGAEISSEGNIISK